MPPAPPPLRATIKDAALWALVTLGLIMLASTSAWVKNVEDPYYFLTRQGWMVGVGLIGACLLARLDPIWLRRGRERRLGDDR